MKIRIVRTNDKRPWTEHIARNLGVKAAEGEYVFLIDIDYIIPKEAIEKALKFHGDKMGIRRRIAVLDKDGNILSDDETLRKHCVKPRWIRKKIVPGHRSQFLMRKSLFWQLGGYNESLDGQWRRTGGAGEKLWRRWPRWVKRGLAKTEPEKLDVFMFPDKRWCTQEPEKLFHSLETK